MKRTTGFLFDERCFWHSTGLHATTLPVGGWVQPPSGAGHAESPETKRRMKNLMDVSGLSRQLTLLSAEPATEEDLLRIHPAHYLQRFKQVSDSGGGLLGEEAPLGPGSYEIAKLSAGLACAAVEAVLQGELDNAYALSRPPGHHCLPDQSMGFCFLANIPIAIERAKARYGLGKVAVLDWDVHHGNGTQHIYWQRGDVLTLSLHQDGCFPAGYSGEQDRGAAAHKGEGALEAAIGRFGAVDIAQVPFARHHGGVTRVAKTLRQCGHAVGQPHFIARLRGGALIPPHAAHAGLLIGVAGHQHRPRRRRHRRGVVLAHAHAPFGQRLQVGGRYLAAERADVGIAHVVHQNDQHIGAIGVRPLSQAR